jgi:DNA polymerase-3 subunit delta'
MWNTIGHDSLLSLLTRSLQAGTTAHAYLFTGPPQVGKRTLALDLAKALNCECRTADDGPCGECRSCRRIAEGKHSDVLTVSIESDAETSRKSIGIGQVREIGKFVSLEPFEGRMRCVIIDGCETMTTEAANAFLKTLEEPPPAVTLMLIADHEESLLETIRSRCQRLALSPLPRDVIAGALTARWKTPPEQADLLAGLARGRLGWAVAALEDESVLAERSETLEKIHELINAGRSDRFAYAATLANRFGKDRPAVMTALDLWREWWRDALLVAAGTGRAVTNSDDLPAIEEAAGRVPLARIVTFLEALERTGVYLQQNVNARLALEVLFLDLPLPSSRGEAGGPPQRGQALRA